MDKPTTKYTDTPASASPHLTPMLAQYFALKKEAGDAVLLFRMGDFYEIFADDALTVAPLLGLAMASREKSDDQKIPFCGMPYHSAKAYWIKLLKLGYKIAIADQLEDPKSVKGLVKRGIVRYLTPGCIDEPDAIEGDSPNYLGAVAENPESKDWVYCLSDVSTGEVLAGELPAASDPLAFIVSRGAKEILARKFQVEFWKRSADPQHRSIPFAILSEHILQNPSSPSPNTNLGLEGVFKKNNEKLGIGLLNATLAHYQKHLFNVSVFNRVRSTNQNTTLKLHENVIRDLEIFESIRRRQVKGSLFSEINQCKTSAGARLLREYLTQPLVDTTEIASRLNCTQYFFDRPILIEKMQETLKGCGDLERLVAKSFSQSFSPTDFYAFLGSAQKALCVKSLIQSEKLPQRIDRIEDLVQVLGEIAPLRDYLMDRIGGESNTDVGLQNYSLFRKGYDAKLDSLRELFSCAAAIIDEYEQKLRSETGISSLKIKHHKTFGLVIEVTNAHKSKIPSWFSRRQTMVNNERFSTKDLDDLCEKLKRAESDLETRQDELTLQLLEYVRSQKSQLIKTSRALALVDVHVGLGWLALSRSYTRPVPATQLKVEGSRHPVVEANIGMSRFQCNNFCSPSRQKIAVITGPNMGGKSTFMRQIALTALMHQIGSFVPASSAELPVFTSFFTRIGASDDVSRGQSTFYIEMHETAHMLRHADENSLIIIDEIGRGTSNSDGLALAHAILEFLTGRIRATTLFATHFHELFDLCAELHPSLQFLQMVVDKNKDEFVFTHRLSPGCAERSYGIEVAKMAGVPPEVVERARQFLADPTTAIPVVSPTPSILTQRDSSENSENFAPMTRDWEDLLTIKESILGLRLERLTPIKALCLLQELQERLAGRSKPLESEVDIFGN